MCCRVIYLTRSTTYTRNLLHLACRLPVNYLRYSYAYIWATKTSYKRTLNNNGNPAYYIPSISCHITCERNSNANWTWFVCVCVHDMWCAQHRKPNSEASSPTLAQTSSDNISCYCRGHIIMLRLTRQTKYYVFRMMCGSHRISCTDRHDVVCDAWCVITNWNNYMYYKACREWKKGAAEEHRIKLPMLQNNWSKYVRDASQRICREFGSRHNNTWVLIIIWKYLKTAESWDFLENLEIIYHFSIKPLA